MSQVEILGVSLPWKDLFTNEGAGKGLKELAKRSQKEANPFLSGSDSNPFLGTSAKENTPQAVQQSTSSNLWADLLTGEDTSSEPIYEPVRENVGNEGSDLLDFLDQVVVGAQNDPVHSASQDLQPSESSSQQYLTCLTSLAGPSMVCCYLLPVALSHYISP